MCFDDRGTEGCSGDGHLDPPLMTGVPHGCFGQFAQPFEVAQIHILERCGVRGVAMKQNVVRPLLPQVANPGSDFKLAGHVRGADQVFPLQPAD